MCFRYIILIVLWSCSLVSQSQNNPDSLIARWKNEQLSDSLRFRAAIAASNAFMYTDQSRGLQLLDDLMDWCQKKDYKSEEAMVYGHLGIIWRQKSDYQKAEEYVLKSLSIAKEIGNKSTEAIAYNNLSNIYSDQGNEKQALVARKEALRIAEEQKDQLSIAYAYGGLGSLYFKMKEFGEAERYFKLSLETYKTVNNEKAIFSTLGNLANVLSTNKKYDEAIATYRALLGKVEKFNLQNYYSIIYKNIGATHMGKLQYDSALYYYNLSLRAATAQGNIREQAVAYNDMAEVSITTQRYPKAVNQARHALNKALACRAKPETAKAARLLYTAHKLNGKNRLALIVYKRYLDYQDSLLNNGVEDELVAMEVEGKFRRKAIADSTKSAELKKVTDAQIFIEEARNKRAASFSYFLYGGIAISVLLTIFIMMRLRLAQKQKRKIEEQQEEVSEQKLLFEERNAEIHEALTYAQQLQNTILPDNKAFQNTFSDSFIIYKPKDIVAGDFYWLEQNGDWVYFAAADCTGHGVPGAMVSVVCANALSKATRDINDGDVGTLLSKARDAVIAEFENDNHEVSDGMDISLGTLNVKNLELKWAGANNPLWVVRNGTQEVTSIKGDKQPIGKYISKEAFTTHQLQLVKGDLLYMFSDGFVDQFGGTRGKKYKSAQFRSFIERISPQPLEEQSKLMDEEFEKWKGSLEQVDDICVIAVKV